MNAFQEVKYKTKFAQVSEKRLNHYRYITHVRIGYFHILCLRLIISVNASKRVIIPASPVCSSIVSIMRGI
jgi:hypothetical protein